MITLKLNIPKILEVANKEPKRRVTYIDCTEPLRPKKVVLRGLRYSEEEYEEAFEISLTIDEIEITGIKKKTLLEVSSLVKRRN